MVRSFGVFVVGLGAMGSATLYALSRLGVKAAGADRYHPPHNMGSSHGQSRIIRQAYFEDPRYVPWVLRAYDLWRQLEADTGASVLTTTGGLMLGATGSTVLEGSLESARHWNLAHEALSAGEIRRRFPPFHPRRGESGLFEPEAGVLRPEAAIRTFLKAARKLGAIVYPDTPVLSVKRTRRGFEVLTDKEAFHSDAVVLASGPWMKTFLPDWPLAVERQVMHWYALPEKGYGPGVFPLFIAERDGRYVYGLPDMGDGVKVALHHGGELTDPSAVDRTVRPDDIAAVGAAVRELLPEFADRAPVRSEVCLYTDTPDGHFVIGEHPERPGVFLAAGFSGHGFKFAPAVGEALAGLTQGQSPPVDLSLFDPCRLARLA